MEFPGQPMVPVVLNSTRPARNRGRLNSEHPNRQMFYVTDHDGMLVPAVGGAGGRVRSTSLSTGYPGGTVVINNEQYHEDRSPSKDRSRDKSRDRSRDQSRDRRDRRDRHDRRHHSRGYRDDDYSSESSDSSDSSRSRGDHHHSRHRHRRRSSHHGHHAHENKAPSPDPETERRLQKLKDLEKREEDEAARERYEEEMILKEARKAKKKKEEEELKKKTIEEYEHKILEERAKAEDKKRKEDDEFRERTIKTWAAAGYSEESVEKLLKKAEKKASGKDKEKGKDHGHDHDNQVMDLTRPTYIKVHRKHLSVDTLEAYNLPWEYDEADTDYIIIKRWIPEREQDKLFEHTTKLRERKLLVDSSVQLRKDRDTLALVRKPSKARSKSRPRSWLLT